MKRPSYYGKLDTDHMSGSIRTIWYSKADEPDPVEYYQLCDREWQDLHGVEMAIDNQLLVAALLDKLNEREQKVIVMRFVEGMTLEEVGHEYKLTRERIRQIEGKACRKLRYWTRESKRLEQAMRDHRERMMEMQ